MSRDAEDEDHTTFLQLGLCNSQGDEPVLSRAAFMLHTAAIVNSVDDGHPGFVPDEYLSAIEAETTITAAELCAAEMWRRVSGGYEVLLCPEREGEGYVGTLTLCGAARMMKVVALRSRPAGGGFKPPHAALAEDRRGER